MPTRTPTSVKQYVDPHPTGGRHNDSLVLLWGFGRGPVQGRLAQTSHLALGISKLRDTSLEHALKIFMEHEPSNLKNWEGRMVPIFTSAHGDGTYSFGRLGGQSTTHPLAGRLSRSTGRQLYPAVWCQRLYSGMSESVAHMLSHDDRI